MNVSMGQYGYGSNLGWHLGEGLKERLRTQRMEKDSTLGQLLNSGQGLNQWSSAQQWSISSVEIGKIKNCVLWIFPDLFTVFEELGSKTNS